MDRLPDWRPRVRAYLAERAATEFAYGTDDCAAFAGGVVEAMTGTNPHKPFSGRYSTLRGGLRVLRRAGYENHIAFAAAILTEVPPLSAQWGDIAVVAGDDGQAFGIVTGAQIEVRRPDGTGVVPLTVAVRAFRV